MRIYRVTAVRLRFLHAENYGDLLLSLPNKFVPWAGFSVICLILYFPPWAMLSFRKDNHLFPAYKNVFKCWYVSQQCFLEKLPIKSSLTGSATRMCCERFNISHFNSECFLYGGCIFLTLISSSLLQSSGVLFCLFNLTCWDMAY